MRARIAVQEGVQNGKVSAAAAREIWDREAKAIRKKAQENHQTVLKAIGR